MNAIYAEFGISKQGHWQALEREDAWTAKELCYVGLMKEVRQMHLEWDCAKCMSSSSRRVLVETPLLP